MLGEQYEIGHTYLFDVIEFLLQAMGPYPTRKSTFLWTRKGKAKWPVEQLWLLSVQPLLEQYVAGLDSTQQKNEIQQLKAIFLNN
jgi:5-methylcytosine-specific restriction protein B